MERASIFAPTLDKAGAKAVWAGCLLAAVLAGSVPASAVEAVETGQKAKPELPLKADPVKTEAAPVPVGSASSSAKPAGEPAAAVAASATTEAQASVHKYCVNIAVAATDARFSWQSKKLLEVETRIKARIAELDAKQAELKAWLDRREQIAKTAKDNLVGIYSKMKPETAAAQISALSDETAAAVLAALTPRQASAIFDEMTPPDRAAKLAGLLGNPLGAPNEKKL